MKKLYLHKKLLPLGLSLVLVATTFTACGSSSSTKDTSNKVESTEVTDESADKEADALIAKVKSIDGNTVTAVVGEINTQVSDNQAPPDLPSNDTSSSSDSKPTAPDANSSTSGDTATPPEKPSGENAPTGGNAPAVRVRQK